MTTIEERSGWQDGWQGNEESLSDWLDRVHPVQYGVIPAGHAPGLVVTGEALAELGERTATGLPVERCNRCPSCEEWSPCTVRESVAELLDQRDWARRIAVALEQQVAAVEAIHHLQVHPGGNRLETVDGEVLSEAFGPEERCAECRTPYPCATIRALSPSDDEDGATP